MSWLLAAICGISAAKEIFTEWMKPVIPASYWRNWELINENRCHISHEEFMKNVRNGKYYSPEIQDRFKKVDLRTILPTDYTTEDERLAAIKAWNNYYKNYYEKLYKGLSPWWDRELHCYMSIDGYNDIAVKLKVPLW